MDSAAQSSIATCLKHVSLLKSEPKQHRTCCKSFYRIRRLKDKRALLILVWSFLITGEFNFYMEQNQGLVFDIQLIVGGLTLPIAGWLADIYFGRYRVIHWSMWTMWASIILTTASSVVAQVVPDSYNHINGYVSGSFMITAAIGFGAFQANVIQFGLDQLCDASTTEITSFISWYIWCAYSSQVAIDFVLKGLDCAQSRGAQLFGSLMMCTQCSLALVSVSLFNHWLIKEPVAKNPFRLVYSVIKYAIKNKQPQLRSAFTYCEDELPSRIDFGKSKYGGPFTIEEVEDVKTFLRLLVIAFTTSILFGIVVAFFMLKVQLSNQLVATHSDVMGRSVNDNKCYSEELTQQIFIFSWVIVIPLYEFVFYPLFNKCLAELGSRTKAVFGLLLHIAAIVAVIIVLVVARYNTLEHNISNHHQNATIQCIFYEVNSALSSDLNYQWMAIPNILYSLSLTTLNIGALEFIISQTPYSMRGLLIGSTYGMLALFAALSVALSFPFTRMPSIWGKGIISCGFWYALLLLVAEIVVGIILGVMVKFYKKRKREDVLPNEHIFAERYYAKEN